MTIPHAELIPLARMMPILAEAGFPTRHFSRKGWSVSRAGDLIGRVRQPFPDRAWGTSRIFRRVESELILMARIRHARMILKTSRDRWFRMEQQALFEREVLGLLSK